MFPGTAYTLLVDGVRTTDGRQAPLIALDFRTEAFPEASPNLEEKAAEPAMAARELASAPVAPVRTYCSDRRAWALPCHDQAKLEDGIWTPGMDSTDGRWRVEGRQPELMSTTLMARVTEAVGLTTLTGQILRVDGVPVAGVEVSIGDMATRTDAQGRFWLYNAPAGRQEVYVDGSTANGPGLEYGQFVIGADIRAGTLTQLPYTMYLPRISARDKVRIASPLKRDAVLTHPDMPGLQIHIPAGTVIRDRKGRVVRELAIVPTPVNRAPFPVADNYPMYFTIEPGGAVIHGLTPESAQGIRIFYPNYDRHPAGTQADFWIYDPADGWRVYGKGRVTSDESRFAPEAGVALHEMMGGSMGVNTDDPPSEGDAPPDQKCCGEGNAGTGGAATAGDPIDLRTGQFVYDEIDITISDVVPIQLSRSYRPRDLKKRKFGIGTAGGFSHRLHSVSGTGGNAMQLVLPNGAALRFNRVDGSGSTGSWRHYGTTSMSGALMEFVLDQGYRVTMRDGSSMMFSGYSSNPLLWTADRYGNRTQYVRDAGLVSRVISPSGRYLDFIYDSDNRISKATDPLGNEWQYLYNADGFLSDVIYPDGTGREYRYGIYSIGAIVIGHRIEEIFDRRGNRLLKNEWETNVNSPEFLRATRQVLADGATYEIDYFHYDGTTLGTLITHPDGSQRRVVFDDSGGLYPVSDTLAYNTALEQTHSFERNSLGQMTARVDPLGRRTEYAYNSEWQVTGMTYLAGTADEVSVSLSYTSEGQPRTVTDPLGRVTTLEYANGCLTGITNPLGYRTDLGCNSKGQPDRVTDALLNTIQLHYLGPDLVRVTDPMSRSVQFRHDPLGRVTAVEDAQGNLSRREYDAEGRVVKLIDPSGDETEIGYDTNGNVAAVLMPNGSGITYEYDERDRVIGRTDNLGQSEYWTWDTMSRVESHTDRKGQTTTFVYDALGRLETTTYHDSSTVVATYDEGDRLLSLADSASGTLGWVYDDLDRVIEAISPQGSIAYEYDAAGRRTAMTPASQARIEYQYDAGDRLRRILQGSEIYEFAYDALDRLTHLTLANGVEAGYAYNEASQLSGIAWHRPDSTLLHTLGYGYDNMGRRVTQAGSLAPQALPAASTGNAFDDNNRQTQYNGQSLTYDGNGNLTGDGARTYVWNARDQLVEIKEGSNTIASFEYDVLGRRYTRTEGGITTKYLYDGLDAVQETQGSSVLPVLTGLNIDERYARGAGANRHYFLTDALGSTRLLADGTGSIVQGYDYDPYGGTHPANTTVQNPYRYTGREQDASGLYYYRARYYHPEMGRFISEDPIGLAGGDLNVYAYVRGNPVSFVDPWGLEACLLTTVGPLGIRDHAAVYTSRGDGSGGPALYDPAGSYGAANGGGSSGIVTGDAASIERFREFHSGQTVESNCKDTSRQEEESIINRAMDLPSASPFQCAVMSSNVLSGEPSFPHVQAGTFWPGNLRRQVGRGP